MNIPTTYYEWITCFDYIKDKPRNDSYIDILNSGRLDKDNTLELKLINELTNMIAYRLEKAVNSFNDYLSSGSVDYNGLSLQIISIRKEFVYAKKLVNIKVISPNNSEELAKGIQKRADNLQEVLENKTVYSDRSGVLNSLIKSNPINRLEEV